MINTHKIILGDCIAGMKTMPDGCVQTCITSPPYFGLRDYQGGTEEIGQEQTPESYIQKMVEVFREVRRILRDDGTVWLNLGDSYASNGCYINAWYEKEHNKDKKHLHTENRERYEDRKAFRGGEFNIKAKDLIGIPWRVAFALQADGWYLRQDIIWHKPNPMPESVTDRCTKAHEYIFMLSKNQKYFYDNTAIKEKTSVDRTKELGRAVRKRNHGGRTDGYTVASGTVGDGISRNKRTVWTVTTKPFRGAHFATFPKDLIEPCVLAGTSEHGCCSKCGAPWNRDVEIKRTFESGSGRSGNLPEGKNGSNLQGGGETKDIRRGPVCHSRTIGWEKTCKCVDAEVVPCTVFDPFTGSGTTAIVALKHNRNFIGTELNEDYIKIAEDRIRTEIPQTLEGVFENE